VGADEFEAVFVRALNPLNMTRAFIVFMWVTLLGLPAAPSAAQTAYPMLMSLRPVAVQAGATAEVTISSRYTMAGAYQVLVSGEGVKAEVVPPEKKPDDATKKAAVDKTKIKITATKKAMPGVRDLRIATPQGVSTVAQLVIVREAVIVEVGVNETPAKAQAITLPAAVCGVIDKNEDVDFYRFQADAGQSLVFRVRCARLEDRIHDLQTHADPILTLRTASGATLATSDNNEYYADPLVAYRFNEAGDYLLEIRDVRYQGNQYWEYCLEINDRPLVECVFPLAVTAGSKQLMQPLGELVTGRPAIEWSVPAGAKPGLQWCELPMAGQRSNPVPVIVADVPLTEESLAPNDLGSQAQLVSVPCGINGRIDREGDLDCFAFEAKKGEAFSFEVIARRAQSALDSHLRILDEKGKQLALNDDLRLGKRTLSDSWSENWTAPADGKYVVEVRDVNLRGGPLCPYYLKVTRSQPYFELYLDSDKTQVAPGTCAALFVRIERKNGFTGEVQLAIDGLPRGVAASCGKILADKGQDGSIALEAEPDAMLGVANVVVRGTAVHKRPDAAPLTLSATATSYQETYLPGGGRGHWPVATHAVAITDPADIRGITLSTYDVTLKPGESKKIEVTIDRSPGFAANVTLDMLMRHLNSVYANTLPPGVTLNDKDAKSLLSGSATQGFLTLVAAKDAPPADHQQAVVMGHVALNFVMKWTYASQPLTISVSSPDK
jgi:hypothetical protein